MTHRSVARTVLFVSILLIAATVVFAGGKPETGEKISPKQAFEAMESGSAIFVDVRDQFAYEQAHIAGAIHIPLDEVGSRVGELQRRGKSVITYCACPAEQTSLAAAVDLVAAGFTDVQVLLGGIGAWNEAGYPINVGPRP